MSVVKLSIAWARPKSATLMIEMDRHLSEPRSAKWNKCQIVELASKFSRDGVPRA